MPESASHNCRALGSRLALTNSVRGPEPYMSTRTTTAITRFIASRLPQTNETPSINDGKPHERAIAEAVQSIANSLFRAPARKLRHSSASQTKHSPATSLEFRKNT
jgi:hypothetical protein